MRLRLPRLSHSVALASLIAFSAQVLFALLMLKVFLPEEVARFSVISQIAFFWMTLSLAQTPLSLLANANTTSAHAALAHAWRTSCWRMAGLLPVALGALALSQIPLWNAALWLVLLCVMQIAWSLAQSHALRQGQPHRQIIVRALPPVVALGVLGLSLLAQAWGSAWTDALLICALSGYSVGAFWLWRALMAMPAVLANVSDPATPQNIERASSLQRDDRSALLRMAHSLSDALIATALIVVWQRLYGPQETGWMSALLRVLGFIPAVVHMAWAQVMLAHTHDTTHVDAPSLQRTGLRLALFASGLIGLMGLGCFVALQMQWLSPHWQGLLYYLLPLGLWQSAASVSAVFSYRPFQMGRARQYSWACIAVAIIQAITLALPWLGVTLAPLVHVQLYAGVSVGGLILLSGWMAKL